MDTTGANDNTEKIIIIHTPHGSHYYHVGQMTTDITNCPMCENDIPFSSECITIKFEDSFPTDVVECVKHSPDDLLDEQERFLKEREKRNFRRMMRGK